MPTFYEIDQNTDEWMALRLGKFTASTFKDLFMAKTTIGYQKAIYKVVYERLTGESPESFTSDYMERGHEIEPLAKEAYQLETFNDITNGGFWDMNEWVGCSPDGLVGDEGLIEIKSPAYNTMIDYLLKKKLPSIYQWQVQGQLMVTERKWCDFMSYHPKLKPLIIRVDRDEKMIEQLRNQLELSISEAQKIIEKIK